MYAEAIDAIDKAGMFVRNGLPFVADYNTQTQTFSKYMRDDACYLGAMLSRGAQALTQQLAANQSLGREARQAELARIERHWALARNLTETCRQVASGTKTGLMPSKFEFTDKKNGIQLIYKMFDLR